MPLLITDLIPGDELQCWMKLGLAIVPVVKGNGTPYYAVPTKPRKASDNALTRFLGWVVLNNLDERVLTLQVSAYNSWRQATGNLPRQVDLSYTAFSRIRKFSAYAIEAPQKVPGTKGGKGYKRPGSLTLGTKVKAYRTVEEVIIV